jgi:uncharacterized protein
VKPIASIVVASIWFLLSPMALAGECPSKGLIDMTVCANTSLHEMDSLIADRMQNLLSMYRDGQQRSLVQGQMNWLRQRDKACVFNAEPTEHLVDCLVAVYREREIELDDETKIQRTYLNEGLALTAPNLEAILDRPNVLNYDHDDIYGAMFFDLDFKIFRHPRTCRELYTLNAGAWEYSTDTIGDDTHAADYEACQFAMFTAQKHPLRKTNSVAVDLKDIDAFSNEFMCLIYSCDDYHHDKVTTVESFRQREREGQISITTGALPGYEFLACEHQLIKSTDAFCFEDFNVQYQISDPADYTGQGQREVVVDIAYRPTAGSMRGRALVVAWYDPQLKAIRPELIDFASRIRLVPSNDPDLPRVPHRSSRRVSATSE